MILLSDLLEAEVRTEGGRKLGRVYDVRVQRLGHRNADGYSLKVVGVVIGGRGIRERFGLDAARVERPVVDREVIAWERIVSFDSAAARVVVREA